MSDLATLQEQLNSDPQLRSQFMKGPAAFLKTAGVEVLPEQARNLAQSLTSLTTRQSVVGNLGQIIIKIDGR